MSALFSSGLVSLSLINNYISKLGKGFSALPWQIGPSTINLMSPILTRLAFLITTHSLERYTPVDAFSILEERNVSRHVLNSNRIQSGFEPFLVVCFRT